MKWHNEPKNWQETDGKLIVMADGKTDYWRVTLHHFIKDDAPFYFEEVTGDFTATVRVTGAYASTYDQAGLMVRANEKVWLKCGIEYVEGRQYASAVITRDFSDWSVAPLEDNPSSVWIRLKRRGEAVEVFFSRDGEQYTMIRQGYLSTETTLKVGMMCAAPQGDGFKAIFEDYRVIRLSA